VDVGGPHPEVRQDLPCLPPACACPHLSRRERDRQAQTGARHRQVDHLGLFDESEKKPVTMPIRMIGRVACCPISG